jgi:hypothetical protein
LYYPVKIIVPHLEKNIPSSSEVMRELGKSEVVIVGSACATAAGHLIASTLTLFFACHVKG